jgi:hypothetical protein
MIPHSLHLLRVVLPRHPVVHHLLWDQSPRHKVHHLRFLTIQIIHLQINLLHKAVVANPKQVKLKQPVIALAKQALA